MGVVPDSKAPTKADFLQCPACAAYVVYDVLAVRKPVCRSGHLRRFLSVQVEAFVKGYFRTTICSTGANLQRLVGCLYHRWLPRVNHRRELLVLSDRGLVALDWLNEDRPGSQSRPWRSLLPALAVVGFRGLVVNGHGCGAMTLTGQRITYAASVSGFAEVLSKAPNRYRRECFLAAGVCLGGMLLSLHLCQRDPPAQLDAALAVSPPFEPAVAARTLSNRWGFNRLLNACITRGLVGRLRDSEEVVRVAKVIRADDVFRCFVRRALYSPCIRLPIRAIHFGNLRLEGPAVHGAPTGRLPCVGGHSLNPERTLLEDEVLTLAGRRGGTARRPHLKEANPQNNNELRE
ncbi:phospholipase ABHD3-like [Amblyomma americanum]